MQLVEDVAPQTSMQISSPLRHVRLAENKFFGLLIKMQKCSFDFIISLSSQNSSP